MKILLTGGGTGGHFYPLIAVTEAIYDLAEEERLLTPELLLMAESKYNSDMVDKWGLKFRKIYAGKLRRYFSPLNITDVFKTGAGIIKAIIQVYSDMPDVVFGKGGYVSFPALLAAKLFGIPVIIHESDSVPGKVNAWAGKFAKRIAVSFPEAAKYFPEEKTALTGMPVRKSLQVGSAPPGAEEIYKLEANVPVILVLGGSQGSEKINDVLLDIAEELVKVAQVVHQCGPKNEKEVSGRLKIVLEKSSFQNRYRVYPFLNDEALRFFSAAANLVISRAGSSAIFEIATWGKASIVVPLSNSAQNHQRGNAYSYARSGAATVIEENNLSSHVLLSEIQRILIDKKTSESMGQAAKKFSRPEAARKIAQEIIDLALEHS